MAFVAVDAGMAGMVCGSGEGAAFCVRGSARRLCRAGGWGSPSGLPVVLGPSEKHLSAFQNRKTMCYAAGVAESGGLDRMAKGFGSRSGVLGFPACRVYLEVLHITAEVEL